MAEDNWLNSNLNLDTNLFLPDQNLNPQLKIVVQDPNFNYMRANYYAPTTPSATPAVLNPTTTTTYRMRGYYIAGSTYEFWITTDPTSANPSGNPLINKSVDSIIAQ